MPEMRLAPGRVRAAGQTMEAQFDAGLLAVRAAPQGSVQRTNDRHHRCARRELLGAERYQPLAWGRQESPRCAPASACFQASAASVRQRRQSATTSRTSVRGQCCAVPSGASTIPPVAGRLSCLRSRWQLVPKWMKWSSSAMPDTEVFPIPTPSVKPGSSSRKRARAEPNSLASCHPSARGTEGENLCLDVSVLGPRAAIARFRRLGGAPGVEGSSARRRRSAPGCAAGRACPRTRRSFFSTPRIPGASRTRRASPRKTSTLTGISSTSPQPLPLGPEFTRNCNHRRQLKDSERRVDRGRVCQTSALIAIASGGKAFSDAFNGEAFRANQDGIFGGRTGNRPIIAFRAAVETHLGRARSVAFIDLRRGHRTVTVRLQNRSGDEHQ